MTAINIFLPKTRGIIMTDSLFIDMRTGEAVELMDKCRMVRDAGMAVAARGDFRVPEMLAEELPDLYANIDQLVADEGEAVRNLYDRFVRNFAGPVFNADVEIMIVGWSPSRDRPIGFYVQRKAGWKFAKIGADGLAGPLCNERELARLRKLGVMPGRDWDLESFDPIRHGIPYMEAQRRMAFPLGATGNRAHVVGGWIMLTEITREGMTQRIIHEWDDWIGRLVKPDPFAEPQKPQLRMAS